ncbi:hypothetical protein EUV02_03845 [Polymorphobacter arshaanensis]|uniref:Uncharacterized protein n=1 Tax=Glacieibacterium arshaanense TaxID=2511025 RepID=A0A4Y9ERA9_9SPHN|nr:hypothetical protein [Polymorphobacter arshaanensis]TFU06155.1 hypothetical protein EUV02_03845 [Polymorphobacter arshaanensis]
MTHVLNNKSFKALVDALCEPKDALEPHVPMTFDIEACEGFDDTTVSQMDPDVFSIIQEDEDGQLHDIELSRAMAETVIKRLTTLLAA